MDLDLDGKVFLITGGTDGLGAALAERLVAERARVVACGRDQSRVAAMNARFGELGGDSLAIVADVTRRGDLEQMVGTAVDRWGKIDGVVNNAGAAAAAKFETISDDQWVADMDLKVMAAVRLTELALPYLRADGGAVVNVLSIAAKSPGARSLPSAASRATGMAITKALSQELGPDGIRVNAVLIGLIESGQWTRRAEAAEKPVEELYEGMATLIPLGRVGRGDEFADLVTYLLSQRASYVTGCAINLDGGMSPVV
ncbi:MAG TPA: SDR family oxidoreductase [Microthrixaceae bacterium]|nr:SDR family oxidoreductase [Microthrixaceae bacterium]